jgi:hypothetical protein
MKKSVRPVRHWLGYGSKGSEEIFHRSTVAQQWKIITKANAYAEVIITDNCMYKAQGDGGTTGAVRETLSKRT